MTRYDAMSTAFEEVTILDKPALFTPLRIGRNTIPVGYHLYEVRHDDDCQGDAVQIALGIAVNHWGSLITRDEIVLSPDGYLDIEPMGLNYCVGDCHSMEGFMEKYPLTQGIAEHCRICGGEVFGYGSNIKMPLCREHYVKTCQLTCYFHSRDECPYPGTDAKWSAVAEMLESQRKEGLRCES